MKIVLFGKGGRGEECLRSLVKDGHKVVLVVDDSEGSSLSEGARALGVLVERPSDPNDAAFVRRVKDTGCDFLVLNGYRRILKKTILDAPRIMAINLHGGRLPQYRGSSPMNWALLNGDRSFGLSAIRVDEGIDTGPVIASKIFPAGPDATIRELHAVAAAEFPKLLREAIKKASRPGFRPKKQNEAKARYFPARFAEDGLVAWDLFTAAQVHNRVRALTEPYPCAFTYFDGRKLKLISTRIPKTVHGGEPGRVYAAGADGVLIAAADRCVLVTSAVFEDTGEPLAKAVRRYDRLYTALWAGAPEKKETFR